MKKEEIRRLIDMIYELEREINVLLKEKDMPEYARKMLEGSIIQSNGIRIRLELLLSLKNTVP